GGNALLGKKSFALRIASKLAKDNGWLAEHMLILTLTSPTKKQYHFTAAFPSACGKTNLAMMLPKLHGWKLQTISDDIAWLKLGTDGRLYAINPEKGFYGVAPGTSMEANPNALIACKKNTIFTNVVLTPDNDVWWENMGIDAPETGIDWTGNPCYRCIDDKHRMAPKPNMTKAEVNAIGYVAAHKNSRFTVPAVNCPVLDKDGFNGIYKGKHTGVPIDAILFGGRRISTVPLITEASNWEHGVFMGSATGSEITAAVISNKIGHVRRDPMAMFPFLGYNITDYFQHWLDIEKISADPTKLPKIYFVNFFRKNAKGKYLWSGFGENIRILKWICDRIDGKIGAKPTAIGNLPFANDLFIKNADGTNIVSQKNLKELLKVDSAEWKKEIKAISAAYDEYDSQNTKKYVPKILRQILKQLKTDLSK
ncbi:MAG: phosphoenolpyruvate carboxykinase (GTP), partial [Acidaminococcaceae bacterium]|nr:phosphoenolpyruvate carboxykinase (GTP) [Acidaminococcaceae bacterium]